MTFSQVEHGMFPSLLKTISNVIFFFQNTSEVSSDPEAASSTMDTLEQQKITMWQSFAVFMTPSIQRVVEFAKRVPGIIPFHH